VSRLYDRERAEASLPMLRDMLPRIRESRRALIDASERITEAVAADGGGVSGGDWFAAQERLRADLTALADEGILLRDPETGLVDFPAERGSSARRPWRSSTASARGTRIGSRGERGLASGGRGARRLGR
jgi:hypothetical protein